MPGTVLTALHLTILFFIYTKLRPEGKGSKIFSLNLCKKRTIGTFLMVQLGICLPMARDMGLSPGSGTKIHAKLEKPVSRNKHPM